VVSLHELVSLSEEEKERKGIAATPGEISQQPKTWEGTRRIFEQQSPELQAFLISAGVTGPLAQRPTIVMIGAGTSDYIGRVLELLLRTEWGCETLVVASTDLLANMAHYVVPGRRYLWISFSRSGDSPEGVAVLKQAIEKYPEVSHLVVTCNAKGRMAAIGLSHARAHVTVLDDAVNDRGLAMTSSFSNMVVFGQCLAHAFSNDNYTPVFPELVRAGKAFLPVAAECARELAPSMFQTVCVLGSGALAGVARESALKISEMTAGRVRTMTESVLGLRHGPMAALNAETLLVCFVSSDQRLQRYEADLLREIGGKGIVAQRVVVGPEKNAVFAGCYERYLTIPGNLPDLYRPPVDVLFGQVLGLYFSLAHNLRPDTPSPGGVITRVVGDFKIYE
jgi:D-galactosamine 6-phosphate deaminase/isomerase